MTVHANCLLETICMICQSLLCGKIKNIINLSLMHKCCLTIIFQKFYWSDRFKNFSDLSQIKDICVTLWKWKILCILQTQKTQIRQHTCTFWSEFSLSFNVFYSNQCLFRYTKMPICLPGFLDHCRNGPFEMLMFIWCFTALFFIGWVINQTMTLSSGLRLLVLSCMMSST